MNIEAYKKAVSIRLEIEKNQKELSFWTAIKRDVEYDLANVTRRHLFNTIYITREQWAGDTKPEHHRKLDTLEDLPPLQYMANYYVDLYSRKIEELEGEFMGVDSNASN